MNLIENYFPDLTPEQKEQFSKAPGLYEHWNQQINVVSRKDIEHLAERHLLHSLAIAKVMPFKPGSKVLDVGTGGGFPGIPLAILFPEVSFTLVDSIGKKIKVVNEVAQALGLKNVVAIHDRVENVDGKFDFVVSRAVTRLSEFYKWIKTKIKKEGFNDLENGILYLKGGDLGDEFDEFLGAFPGRYIKTYDIPQYFKEEFFETKKVVYVRG